MRLKIICSLPRADIIMMMMMIIMIKATESASVMHVPIGSLKWVIFKNTINYCWGKTFPSLGRNFLLSALNQAANLLYHWHRGSKNNSSWLVVPGK